MKILPYIIMLSIQAVFILSIVYLSHKLVFVFSLKSTWPAYVSISLLATGFLTAFMAFFNAEGALAHTLYKIAAITIGLYLFSVLSFLILDGLSLLVSLKPFIYGLLGFSMALIMSVGGYWNASRPQVTSVTVPMQGLNNAMKAVHLSDIHIGHFRTTGFLQKIIAITNAQNPDIVFITGDYLDSKYALDKRYFTPLKQLKAPVYFVDGNHDNATNNNRIVALMRSVGVTVLENDLTQLNDLQIVGLKHMSGDRNSFDMHASGHQPTIEETLPHLAIDTSKATVLLHHAPNGIKHANQYGIDLYLAGHTHAGQIFPFNFIANLMFEYNRGLHDYKGTKVYVSEGVGTFGPPFRIGTKSEIISLTLVPN